MKKSHQATFDPTSSHASARPPRSLRVAQLATVRGGGSGDAGPAQPGGGVGPADTVWN